MIHNCADAARPWWTFMADNTLLLDDFEFRTASPLWTLRPVCNS